MRWLKGLLVVVLLLLVVYLVGPNPSTPEYTTTMPQVPPATQLENIIEASEAAHTLRPNNHARIVWANDSLKQRTAYSLVYLHGFSASQEEGEPTHRNVARKFGCNLYLSRLSHHGIDTTEQLLGLTPENYWETAKQALAIGRQLGDKVILMGTSTGGTQALQLAAAFPNEIAALVLYSPNIAINDPNAWILNNPWGLQIARLVKGGNYNTPEDNRAIYKQYWNKPYRLEATVALEELIETTMNDATFAKVKQPVLLLYYYKDELHQDPVVKVSAMQEMFKKLGTPAEQKRAIALPNTGDHVIASHLKSKDLASVHLQTEKFLSEVLHIEALKK